MCLMWFIRIGGLGGKILCHNCKGTGRIFVFVYLFDYLINLIFYPWPHNVWYLFPITVRYTSTPHLMFYPAIGFGGSLLFYWDRQLNVGGGENSPHGGMVSDHTNINTLIHSNSAFSIILCFIPLRQVDTSSRFDHPTTNQERPAGSGCEGIGCHVEVISHNASSLMYFC